MSILSKMMHVLSEGATLFKTIALDRNCIEFRINTSFFGCESFVSVGKVAPLSVAISDASNES